MAFDASTTFSACRRTCKMIHFAGLVRYRRTTHKATNWYIALTTPKTRKRILLSVLRNAGVGGTAWTCIRGLLTTLAGKLDSELKNQLKCSSKYG